MIRKHIFLFGNIRKTNYVCRNISEFKIFGQFLLYNQVMKATTQVIFFEKITKSSLLTGKKFIDEISDLLNVSKSVAYDRINGKKLLNFDEIILLSLYYKVSLDELLYPTYTGFHLDTMQRQPQSFEIFLQELYKNTSMLSNIPNCEVSYSAIETPVFYYLFEPKLILFKMYIWSRTIWNNPSHLEYPFSINILSTSENSKLIVEIQKAFNQLHTIEFWNTSMIDSTIDQIRYAINSDLFSDKNDVTTLLDCQMRILEMMESIAAKGRKESGKRSEIYHAELVPTPTLIAVNSKEQKVVYNIYDSPNFMTSFSEKTFDYTLNLFEKMKKSSLLLGEDRQRSRFFKHLKNKLDDAKAEFLG